MSKPFRFKIVTPERIVYEDDIVQVSLPTAMGYISVLRDHEPMVALLRSGELTITRGSESDFVAVSGGLIYIAKNVVVVLADTAEHAREIDEAKAEEARRRAERTMQEKQIDSEEYAEATAAFARELARIRVAKKYKSVTRKQQP